MNRFTALTRKIATVSGCLFMTTALYQVNAQSPNVWTQHNDNGRSGVYAAETTLTPSNVNQNNFGMLFKEPVDDQVFAQPLIINGVNIAGGTHKVLYVATTNNSVYAFDADSGIQYWHINFGAAPTVQQIGGITCTDMLATTGIVGTPAIDSGTPNSLWVVDQLYNGGNEIHQLHRINLSTGADYAGSPVTIAANEFTSKNELNRPAVLYANGNVYFSFGSHCDQNTWKGMTFGYNATTLAQIGVFNPTPNDNGSAIWQSGNGPAADSSGSVYVITGNGTWDGNSDFSETMLKMSGTNLSLQDWHTPSNYQSLDNSDTDLTTSGIVLLPNNEAIGGGKDGVLRVVKTGNMGHLGDNGAVQNWQATSNHIHSLNFFNNNLYLWGQSDYLRVYNFNGTTFNTTPTFKGTQKAIGHPGASISISANGTSNGILWATTNTADSGDGGGAWHGTVPGILYAFNLSGMGQIYNNEQNPTRDDCGNYAKFTPTSIASGKVYMPSFGTAATLSGAVCVYGELSSTTNLIPNGTYQIVSVNSGMAMESPGFSHVNALALDQWTTNTGGNQLWSVINLGNNVITMTNGYSSQVVDVAAASKASKAVVDQWPNNNQATNQQWNVISLGGGQYELTNVNSGLALDVAGASKNTGAAIQQYAYNGGANQKWTFTAKP
jgi:hypothetical protein